MRGLPAAGDTGCGLVRSHPFPPPGVAPRMALSVVLAARTAGGESPARTVAGRVWG